MANRVLNWRSLLIPILILLDLNMPGMNGLETLDKLREKSLSGRIVVFSVSNHEEDVSPH
ncbi:transcriptional regulator NarL [Escherichia coli]|uniref:Transcriptional regulator NarL n=1 Tax=Escherichia coli TaxID=562 RepID=A0A376W2E0_ECOLX|nr:transcriptional regulator NarL [Escherichia coli]